MIAAAALVGGCYSIHVEQPIAPPSPPPVVSLNDHIDVVADNCGNQPPHRAIDVVTRSTDAVWTCPFPRKDGKADAVTVHFRSPVTLNDVRVFAVPVENVTGARPEDPPSTVTFDFGTWRATRTFVHGTATFDPDVPTKGTEGLTILFNRQRPDVFVNGIEFSGTVDAERGDN